MENLPEFREFKGETLWSYTFNTFEATVYVPKAQSTLLSDILNYGFISPYLLVFAEKKMSDNEMVSFAAEKGFTKIAGDFASSVVFINPVTSDWKTASKDIFSEIITNSKIHELYINGCVKNYNRFVNKIDGYYIRGAIFRTFVYGKNEAADYIARNCLVHFEGDGLWGKSDIAPVTCVLENLSIVPEIQADDIPLISYSNSEEINKVITEKCKYALIKDKADIPSDYYSFAQKFRRMTGPLNIDENLYEDGLIREPHFAEVTTSPDNFGKDKGTKTHKIGYFAFYNKGIFDKGKVPLVLGFHGGGDSCFFFSIMAGWARICHRHDFLLVTVENHLDSTATEMQELIEILKKQYPIDESRIYATGFSMGGIKTWDLIQEYPLSIAAAAPMDATVDIGENVYFRKIEKEVNTTEPVPIFYAGGEITPLPELPFQEQKCLNRMAYALKLNGATAEYNVKLEDKDNWKNKIWGIDGDITYKSYDKSRDATLTMQLFKNRDEKIYNIFGSISGQGHDCREHTCEHAWRFMSSFRRDEKGKIQGGENIESEICK